MESEVGAALGCAEGSALGPIDCVTVAIDAPGSGDRPIGAVHATMTLMTAAMSQDADVTVGRLLDRSRSISFRRVSPTDWTVG